MKIYTVILYINLNCGLNLHQVENFLTSSRFDNELLNQILIDGKMDGFYTINETQKLF